MVSRNNIKALWVILGIFLAGAGTGTAVTLAWSHHRLMRALEPGSDLRTELRMQALAHALNLDSDQRAKITRILQAQGPERRRLIGETMRQCGAPVRAHKAKTDSEIRRLLNPEQQTAFDALAKRQEERYFSGPAAAPSGS